MIRSLLETGNRVCGTPRSSIDPHVQERSSLEARRYHRTWCEPEAEWLHLGDRAPLDAHSGGLSVGNQEIDERVKRSYSLDSGLCLKSLHTWCSAKWWD